MPQDQKERHSPSQSQESEPRETGPRTLTNAEKIALWVGVLAFLSTVIAAIIEIIPPLIDHTGPGETPVFTATATATSVLKAITPATPLPYFNIYTDADASDNYFAASGKMGDVDDIQEINVTSPDRPHSGTTAIKIVYLPEGQGNHICPFGINSATTCRWAGLYWQNPANNWGTVPNAGYELSAYKKLTFWARADAASAGAQIKFLVGGLGCQVPTPVPYPDSLCPARESGWKKITDQWQYFEIGLDGADLSYVIGGFGWTTNWDVNEVNPSAPRRIVFYLDDIRFEH